MARLGFFTYFEILNCVIFCGRSVMIITRLLWIRIYTWHLDAEKMEEIPAHGKLELNLVRVEFLFEWWRYVHNNYDSLTWKWLQGTGAKITCKCNVAHVARYDFSWEKNRNCLFERKHIDSVMTKSARADARHRRKVFCNQFGRFDATIHIRFIHKKVCICVYIRTHFICFICLPLVLSMYRYYITHLIFQTNSKHIMILATMFFALRVTFSFIVRLHKQNRNMNSIEMCVDS